MFKQMLSFVLSFLNVEAFSKVEGKSKMTDEQRNLLIAEYGAEFVSKFEVDLAQFEAGNADPARDRLAAKFANLETIVNQQKAIVEEQKAALETMKTENATLKGQVEKLADKPETEPAAEYSTNEKGKKVLKFKPNMGYEHNKIAAQVLAGNHSVLAAGETINVDSVITEFGALIDYVKLDMIGQIFQGFETAQHLNWKREIHSYKATRSLITSVVQQFVPKWTELGATSFTPIEIPLRRFKINVAITPSDVKDWILGMYDESKDLEEHPITKYIVNQLIAPKAMEDLDDICANGEYEELVWSTVTEGAAGQDPLKSIDGYVTQLKKDKAAPVRKMNFIQLASVITDSNILTQMELFVDAIDKKYKRKDMPVFIDPTLYRIYKRAYKKLYGEGSGTTDPNFGGDVIDYTKNRLVPMSNLTDSGAIVTTPKENFIGLRHINEPGATNLRMKSYDYDTHVIGEFRFGIGFAIAEAVFYFIPDQVVDSQPAGGGI